MKSLRQRKDTSSIPVYEYPMSGMDPETSDPFELKISQLLARDGVWSGAILSLRMACVGCYLDGFHSLRQALRIYGIPESDFLRTLAREQRRQDDHQGEEAIY